MCDLGLTIFPVLAVEHQYILLVIVLDQQHCSLPMFLICENNIKTCVISSLTLTMKHLHT